jgi:uncharacterized protein (TIGR02588 family)
MAVLGMVLIAGTVAILLTRSLGSPERLPDVSIQADSVTGTDGGYQVRFRAVNRGERTATSVVVRGELTLPSGAVEVSEVQLDYVPGRSERTGALFFTQDPRRGGALALRALGYADP